MEKLLSSVSDDDNTLVVDVDMNIRIDKPTNRQADLIQAKASLNSRSPQCRRTHLDSWE